MMSKKLVLIAFVVSLGGFLFGFDAGIISGVMSYVGPQFNLTEPQIGWVVSSPSFVAMIAMLFAGRLSDMIGRKRILLIVAFLYVFSALASAYASSYILLYSARMVGGLAFGAALVLAPIYIAEVSTPENRGKLVAIQQLNIVLGFFAAFLSNYFFNKYNVSTSSYLSDENVWRWMLGVEAIPALIYFIALFFIPKSPRWLSLKGKLEEAKKILFQIHDEIHAKKEIFSIQKIMDSENNQSKIRIKDLLKKSLRFTLGVGIIIGILQQITGINAIYFYATDIFKQTGIGTDASFSSGVLLSSITVVFTLIAMYYIDRMGRRPLLLVGTAGVALSLLICAYGFHKATYQLTSEDITSFEFEEAYKLTPIANVLYINDVDFKNSVKSVLGNQVFGMNDGSILEAATTMNATLVLIGILGFVACFAFSLGPVMWVMLSELYPIKYKGLAIGLIAFLNSLVSSVIQLIFPWELSNLGSALSFFNFGIIALIGFFVLLRILPETKGMSLEEMEFVSQ